jgi:zinc protease
VEELTEVVFREIEAFKTEGPVGEDVEKVRQTGRRTKETSLRENRYWASQLLSAARFDRDPREIQSYHLLDWFSVDQVREAARLYLRTDNYALFTLYPEKAEQPRP